LAGVVAVCASETFDRQHELREIFAARADVDVVTLVAVVAQRGQAALELDATWASFIMSRGHAQARDAGPGSDSSVTARTAQPSFR
jgi:hypothetical protein